MNKLIVSKFGGSSMADSKAMNQAMKICLQYKTNIVVVSATYGTTNQLVSLVDYAPKGEWDECAKILKDINCRHINLAKELNCSKETIKLVENEIHKLTTLVRGVYLLKECSDKTFDSIVSTGERLSSLIFASHLGNFSDISVICLPVGTVLKTNDSYSKAKPLFDEIKRSANTVLSKVISGSEIVVTQGFIGQTIEGNITTLGRGGSDYSAAILAEAIEADLLQIWTDVAGIATMDPRICPDATPISELSFQEAAELATFGAKILHPTTILPAQREGIDVFVGSTFEPDKPGTWIRKSCDHAPLVRAIALRKDQTILTISTPKMLDAYGFLSKIFSIFEKYQISVDLVTTSEISVCVSVDKATLKNKKLFNDLEELASIKIEENLASISLIGNNINDTPKLAADIFTTLSTDKLINVRMICMGASHHHFCILVNNDDATYAVKKLHTQFLEK